jgi:cytidyltransferase-like protein
MATFGEYFHSVCQDDSRKARLRSGSDKRGIPLLSKDRVNRVLIYPGSFNPPHVGHLAVLRHAFESCPDLNIVAGIVLPARVEHIEKKNYQSGRCLALSEEQRLELWKRDARFPAWAFAPRYKSSQLTEEIANAAKKDGYEILYIGLGGPDIWDFSLPPTHMYTSFTEHLISDAARGARFLGPDGVPQPIERYTTWKRLELDLQPGAERLRRTKRRLRNSSVKGRSRFPVVR